MRVFRELKIDLHLKKLAGFRGKFEVEDINLLKFSSERKPLFLLTVENGCCFF